ncbi:MAG: DUF1206 domain-containing protein [Myxococcota bacterium]|nr:DUF1206 domain-containing protein [Myxococcota bacterium]
MSLLEQIRKHARPIARWGCVAIGTVYLLVGSLALVALSGRFTGHADEQRIIRVVLEWPGGFLIIWAIVVGLAGYALWRIVEVFADPYEYGTAATGILKRLGVGLTGLGYGLVAYSAGAIALGPRGTSESSEQQQQSLVADVLAWPGGAWWVGAAGVIVIGFGGVQYWMIAKRSYAVEIDLKRRSRAVRVVIHVLAWAGYAARGIILGVLGYFLVRSAVTHDPTAVGDTDTAFDFIGGGVAGDTAFFFVALATAGYGIFMYLSAAFYRFERDAEPNGGP